MVYSSATFNPKANDSSILRKHGENSRFRTKFEKQIILLRDMDKKMNHLQLFMVYSGFTFNP